MLEDMKVNTGKEDNIYGFNVDRSLRVQNIDSVEILILETTGAYGYRNRTRAGYDHVKGVFNSLAMLRRLVKSYHRARISASSKIRLYFLHEKGIRIVVHILI